MGNGSKLPLVISTSINAFELVRRRTLIKNHCDFFKEASYVMKDFPLQETRITARVKKQKKQKV